MAKYPILEAQMLLSGRDRRALSKDLGVHYNPLCRKLRGEMPFTLDEALRVKRLLLTDLPLERLFETPGQDAARKCRE